MILSKFVGDEKYSITHIHYIQKFRILFEIFMNTIFSITFVIVCEVVV